MTDLVNYIQNWVLKSPQITHLNEPRFKIETLGNPGWMISLNIESMGVPQLLPTPPTYWRSVDDWVFVTSEESQIRIGCSPLNFLIGIETSIEILNSNRIPESPPRSAVHESNRELLKLQKWYFSNCNENWEYEYGLSIQSLPDPGWELNLDLLATSWEGLELEPQSQRNSEQDWLHLRTTERGLQATCGPLGLSSAIDQALALLTPENMTFPD
jgi:Immunity protein 53